MRLSIGLLLKHLAGKHDQQSHAGSGRSALATLSIPNPKDPYSGPAYVAALSNAAKEVVLSAKPPQNVVMTSYNQLKSIYQGVQDETKRTPMMNRLNSALGICQLKSGRVQGGVYMLIDSKTHPGFVHKVGPEDMNDCACEDFKYRGRKGGFPCKHQIASVMLRRAWGLVPSASPATLEAPKEVVTPQMHKERMRALYGDEDPKI